MRCGEPATRHPFGSSPPAVRTSRKHARATSGRSIGYFSWASPRIRRSASWRASQCAFQSTGESCSAALCIVSIMFVSPISASDKPLGILCTKKTCRWGRHNTIVYDSDNSYSGPQTNAWRRTSPRPRPRASIPVCAKRRLFSGTESSRSCRGSDRAQPDR